MTSGTVVVLGPYGRNLGAGMSGGETYVHDPGGRLRVRLNAQLVEARRLDPDEATLLRSLVERHAELTGSAKASALLRRWDAASEEFWHVAPKAAVAEIQAAAEGTVGGAKD
jgi:glutamate synthase domain-containing protein 3